MVSGGNDYFDIASDGLKKGIPVDDLVKLPVREKIGRFKYISSDKIESEYQEIIQSLHREIDALLLEKEES